MIGDFDYNLLVIEWKNIKYTQEIVFGEKNKNCVTN
jgi:hypothetical protein